MKLIILLVLVAFIAAQDNHNPIGEPLAHFLDAEVAQMLLDHPDMDMSSCVHSCDRIISHVSVPEHETVTDDICQHSCDRHINHPDMHHDRPPQ